MSNRSGQGELCCLTFFSGYRRDQNDLQMFVQNYNCKEEKCFYSKAVETVGNTHLFVVLDKKLLEQPFEHTNARKQ